MSSPEKRSPGGQGLANADHDNTTADAPIVPPSRYAAKRIARLQAEAALAGIALYRLDDGRLLASRWNLTREIEDDQIEGWLRTVGGRP